jgi:undecaprenyl-diphosphatase
LSRTPVAVVLVGAILVVCFWKADAWLYRILHENYNHATRPVPTHLKLATRLLRSLEDWGENVFIACVAFAMWRLDPQRRGRILCLAAAAAATAGTVEILKRGCGRARPEVSQGQTRFDWLARSADPLGDGHSFPSGHTAAAAAYSGSLAAFYPPVRPVVAFLAAGCGASRIWKERHFLGDCIAALAIGWTFAHYFATSKRWAPIWRACDRFLAPDAAGLLRRHDARQRHRRGTGEQLRPGLGLLR